MVKVVPKEYLSVFTPNEFEMILNGYPNFEINDWEEFTSYKGAYYKNHQIIKWFWEILKEFNQEKLKKFFQYCTGSNRLPVEGFKYI